MQQRVGEKKHEDGTGETILTAMGDAHVDVIVDRLKRKFGASVKTATPQVPYRETIRKPAKIDNKFKRQTGGHGQYGHVVIEFEPGETGEGFRFGDKIVGGVVPKQYIPAVEKGLRETLTNGVLEALGEASLPAGKYTQLRYVNPWPRPLQKPHPPVWIPGSSSPETAEFHFPGGLQDFLARRIEGQTTVTNDTFHGRIAIRPAGSSGRIPVYRAAGRQCAAVRCADDGERPGVQGAQARARRRGRTAVRSLSPGI